MAAWVSQSLIYKKPKENRLLRRGGGGENAALTLGSYSFQPLDASVFSFPVFPPKLESVVPSEGSGRAGGLC